ncbi:hypothetical protein GCM10008090_25360 [Arenicella chitinivorans]|uniref:DUF934 domain-containing protein n=1 Tax=Arenicella chitinivorans TaxID=1329800 RepID=A0A918VQL6_9GAMM|nr:DUF934 domain-containing protein [Arenicella chitinivorans]GHA14495.1 hypothetical protein GCM10008090_25360 [Arenicella chitinivorans]
MTANRNLKARPKATPDRIQNSVQSTKAIVNRTIVDATMLHVAETDTLTVDDLPSQAVSVPLNLWLDHSEAIVARGKPVAVQLAADEAPEDIAEQLNDIDIIVLPFVSHADGRSYSHAYKLRTRFGFKGEIRAIGDVKFDQLGFLSRVGFDAFELPDGESLETALRAFNEFSEVYQPSADQGRLIFSRRRAIH